MNAPTLFDAAPRARTADPVTSHAAAERVKPGNSALVEAIQSTVAACKRWGWPAVTAFQIAASIELSWPGRWDEGTIRTAIARAGLRAVDTEGRSPRGSRCIRYSL